jgi:DNA-binding response OmpR family regulator
MAQMTSVSTPIPYPGELLRASPFPVRRGAILIVEDRDDVREGLQQLLELHGFLVFDAADAEQAWTHLQADPDGIALVLLDLMLPGAMSGRELRARQLSNSRLASIPTVVISACEPDLRGRAQLRPEAWLEKPFRFDALLEVVKKYVRPETGGLAIE